MVVYAQVRDLRREQLLSNKVCADADAAARQLLVLLKLDGWKEPPEQTRATLITGQAVQHKNFAYRVAVEADEAA
jgi:hypothetical protein